MCKSYSAIIDMNHNVLDHPISDSHEDIIKLHKLQDIAVGPAREWLRVEMFPKRALDSLNVDDWEYHLDTQSDGGLPGWYDRQSAIDAVWDRLSSLLPDRYHGQWEGNLYLRGCTSLTSLPEGLTVGGNLYLRGCTSLTSLPEGLTVGGNLDLSDCTSLTSLPEGLTVGGQLDLRGCTGLISLPNMPGVKGQIYR